MLLINAVLSIFKIFLYLINLTTSIIYLKQLPYHFQIELLVIYHIFKVYEACLMIFVIRVQIVLNNLNKK